MTGVQADNLIAQTIALWPNATITKEQAELFKTNLSRLTYDDALTAVRTHRTESTAPSPEFAVILRIADKLKLKRADQMRMRYGNRLIDCRRRAMAAKGVAVETMSDMEFSVRHARAIYASTVLPLLRHANAQAEPITLGKGDDAITLKPVKQDIPRSTAISRYDQICTDHRGMMAEAGIASNQIEDALALITIEDNDEFRKALERFLIDTGWITIPTV